MCAQRVPGHAVLSSLGRAAADGGHELRLQATIHEDALMTVATAGR